MDHIVTDNAMAPAYAAGDCLTIDPSLPVMVGKNHLFRRDEAQGAGAVVGRLLAMTDAEWLIEQHGRNPTARSLRRSDFPVAERVTRVWLFESKALDIVSPKARKIAETIGPLLPQYEKDRRLIAEGAALRPIMAALKPIIGGLTVGSAIRLLPTLAKDWDLAADADKELGYVYDAIVVAHNLLDDFVHAAPALTLADCKARVAYVMDGMDEAGPWAHEGVNHLIGQVFIDDMRTLAGKKATAKNPDPGCYLRGWTYHNVKAGNGIAVPG